MGAFAHATRRALPQVGASYVPTPNEEQPFMIRSSTVAFVAALCVSPALPAHAQATSGGFLGVEIWEKVGCVNDPATAHDRYWLRRDANFQENRRQLWSQIEAKYKSKTRAPHSSTWTWTEGKPLAIGLYRMTLSCVQWSSNERKNVTNYRFFFGRDAADLDERAIARQREYPKEILAIERVELIDPRMDLTRLRPPEE
jgi:hypothetical protein